MKAGEKKVIRGHSWEWQPGTSLMAGHWKSTSGNLVRVFPAPFPVGLSWFVTVCDEEKLEFSGEKMRLRAFAVAEGYTRQNRTKSVPAP